MARRKVTRSEKDSDGDITALCNPVSNWERIPKPQAIGQIERGVHEYYVEVNNREVDIHVVNRGGRKYLRTNPDQTTHNNLDDLPDC
jgi:hypothetical protein